MISPLLILGIIIKIYKTSLPFYNSTVVIYFKMPMSFAWFVAIYRHLVDGTYPSGCTDANEKRRIKYQAKKYFVDGDRLLEMGTGREVVHEGNAVEIIRMVHGEGHLGVVNTVKKLLLGYVCTEAREIVAEVVKTCETCQFRARVDRSRHNPGYIVKTPRHPFFMVGCDAVGPLTQTARGNKYILVATDYLTRWPMALAVPEINAVTTQKFLYGEIVAQYGVPNYLLTDRGSNFVATLVHEFLAKIGCKHITTTSWRPNCNGACERLNQTLCRTIAKLARDEDKIHQWDNYIASALLAVRTMKNSATGFTPAFLLYGYEFMTPVIWMAPREDFVEDDWEETIKERAIMIQEKLKEAREHARMKSDEKKKKEKAAYDRTVGFRKQFEVGEEVLMKDMLPASKFADKWIGPFRVLKVNKNGTYHLVGSNSRKLDGAVNGDKLTAFHNAKLMVPDVTVTRAQQQFKSWVARFSTVPS